MQTKIVKENDNTIYNVQFSSLLDLYEYLKSNPEINKIFKNRISNTSITDITLDDAIEYLITGYKKGLDNFLKANNKLKEAIKDTSDNRRLVRSIYGGVPLAPLVASGVPACMLKYDLTSDVNIRNIYYSLSYSASNKESQIINRGLATLYIINALEEKGDFVNLYTFDYSNARNEYTSIEITLKKPGEYLDVSKCYFPMVREEFLKRILFRVLESIPVEENIWNIGYGRYVKEEETKKHFNITKNDIFIPQPIDIGIKGENIYDDTISLIENLNLKDEFDTNKIKKLKR